MSTPSLRGDAAIKDIPVGEAHATIDARRVVVLGASDYSVARRAVQFISRDADDMWDMHDGQARQRLAEFIASALHREQRPGLTLYAEAAYARPRPRSQPDQPAIAT